MITLRPSDQRGHVNHGWLDSYYTFSFANYYDPRHRGFRQLRVFNEDRFAAGQGFPMHDHQDMEIVTYVISGALKHEDSMGNGTIIRAGDVQRMTAGTGIMHSEVNASLSEPVHLLQIWVYPGEKSLTPGYEQRHFSAADKRGRLLLIGSHDGADDSITIHQDLNLYAAVLDAGTTVEQGLAAGRHVWLHVVSGNLHLDGKTLETGDAAAISGETSLRLAAEQTTELLLFDLA